MPRPKTPDIRTIRQQQILYAARAVFAKEGFANARMDDIALASGFSKGTLYLYYKSKDDLIVGLMGATFQDLLTHAATLLETEGTVASKLQTLISQSIVYMQLDPSTLNLAHEFYAVAARQPAVRDFLQSYFAAYQQTLATLFAQGIMRGEYADFDTAQVAMTLVALLEGFTLLWFTDPDHVALEERLPRAVEQLLAGLPKHGANA